MALVLGTDGRDFIHGATDGRTPPAGANDVPETTSGHDTIEGGEGDDTIFGGAGPDEAVHNIGSGGADRIDLESGDDVVRVTAATPTEVRLTLTLSEIGDGAVNDSNTRRFQDGGLAVRMQAENGSDALVGPITRVEDEGITFVAGGGVTFDLRDLPSGLEMTQYAFREGPITTVRLGTNAADTLGSDAGWYVNGGAGDDWLGGRGFLDGGIGADTMVGGSGPSVFVVDNVGDVIEEYDDIEYRSIYDKVLSYIDFDLAVSDLEQLVLLGDGDLNGYGNYYRNELTGNSGDNLLDGRQGVDTMAGGAGDDTYIVDGDIVRENAGEGTDLVISSVGFSAAGQAIENITLTGTANAFATGNELANHIIGNDGANAIDGGAGADTMEGGRGDDSYVVDDAGDRIVEVGSGGLDSVTSAVSFSLQGSGLENLTLTGSADLNAIGNSAANALTGNSGDNLLDGLTGVDTMTGGAGNDIYVVRDAGDRVIEIAGGGTDLVRSAATFSMAGANLENLTLTGAGDVDGVGNTLGNVITGNGGDNALNGMGGADTLTGGAGVDVFMFTTKLGAANVDVIEDFSVPYDTIRLENAAFAGLRVGTPSADAFVIGTAAQDAQDRIIYDQTSGALFFDRDGTGARYDAVQFAELDAGLKLTNADFLVT
jgi:Ca2+-binding RTX toxin-like protein